MAAQRSWLYCKGIEEAGFNFASLQTAGFDEAKSKLPALTLMCSENKEPDTLWPNSSKLASLLRKSNYGKQNTGNQNSGNQAAAGMPPGGTVPALEVFCRAIDEHEFARNEPIRSSGYDSSVYRRYYNTQNGGLACKLKKQWTLDTNVEVFMCTVFIDSGMLACNLSETPPKIFEVTQLCCLDLTDNPLS